MFTRLRLLTLLVFCVIATSNFIGRATPLKVTSKERMEYQNQIKHFLQETYYATLGLAITEEDIHREVAEDLMTEDAVKYQPEFYLHSQRQRYMSPAQYLMELAATFRNLDGEQIMFSVSNIAFGRDFKRYGLSGCYVQADYDLTIQYKEQTLVKRSCRMICLFPKASYSRRVLALQVESVKDIYIAEARTVSSPQSNPETHRQSVTGRTSKNEFVAAKESKTATHTSKQSKNDAKGIMGNSSESVSGESVDNEHLWDVVESKIKSFSWIDWLVIFFVFLLTYLILDGRPAKGIANVFGWKSTWLEDFLETIRELEPQSTGLKITAYLILSLLSVIPFLFFMPIELNGCDWTTIVAISFFAVMLYGSCGVFLWFVGLIICYFFQCIEEKGILMGTLSFFKRITLIVLGVVLVCFPLTWLYILLVYLAGHYGWGTINTFNKKIEKKLDSLFDFMS